MALIKEVNGKTPSFGKSVFLADNATVIGDVKMGDNGSIWFNAVVRGDVNIIRMGNKVNIQDGVIIHGTYETGPTILGNRVAIGHGAIIHGCTIEDNVLIGMGAIVMDGAVIKSNTIIAAGSTVIESTITQPEAVYAGIPAKKIKKISKDQIAGIIDIAVENYLMYSKWYTGK